MLRDRTYTVLVADLTAKLDKVTLPLQRRAIEFMIREARLGRYCGYQSDASQPKLVLIRDLNKASLWDIADRVASGVYSAPSMAIAKLDGTGCEDPVTR